MGFSVGIDSTKVSLSEIIYTFPRPSGRRRENGAKHHSKIISAKFEIKFWQNFFVKNIFFNLNHIYIYSTASRYTHLNN